MVPLRRLQNGAACMEKPDLAPTASVASTAATLGARAARSTANATTLFSGLGVGGYVQNAGSSFATSTLQSQAFFWDLDAQLQQALPESAEVVRYSAGTVLFQQGDPPGGTYIILSGEVGTLRFLEGQDDEQCRGNLPARSSRSQSAPSSPKASARNRTVSELSRPWTLEDWELARLAKTAEGFSSYQAHCRIFGDQLQTLGPGASFGEAALVHPGEARPVTVLCIQDSEFLVVHRGALEHFVSREEAALHDSRKLSFLREHVPGIRNQPNPDAMPGGRIHPMHFFREAYFPKGHRFFRQGSIAEDAIYVITAGAVEIRYKQQEVLLNTCSQLPTCKEALDVQKVKRQAGAPPHSSTPVSRRRNMAGRKGEHVIVFEEGSYLVSTLREGAVFGSLLPFSVAGQNVPEPFTAMANQSCEVYCATGAEVAKLPLSLLENLREYFSSATKWRLERVRTDRRGRA